MKRPLLIALVLAAAPALAGCLDNGSSELQDRLQLARLRQEIDAMVRTGCGEGAQCLALPLGSKPCGGPWSYLIYSSATPDTALLRRRVAAYNAFESALNRKWGWVSTCDMAPPPRPGCVDGACVDLNRQAP